MQQMLFKSCLNFSQIIPLYWQLTLDLLWSLMILTILTMKEYLIRMQLNSFERPSSTIKGLIVEKSNLSNSSFSPSSILKMFKI